MKLRCAFALLAAVAFPVMAQSAPAAVPASAADAHKAAADELALVLTPDSSIEPQVDLVIRTMITQLRRSEPDLAELDQEFPGLLDAVGTRVRPIMVRAGRKTLPLYRADLSNLYEGNLTTEEMRQAAAFFRTPEMRAFVSTAQGNLTFEKSTAAALDQREASTSDVQSDVRAAAQRTEEEISPAQRRKLMAFVFSPVGRKLSALNPRKQAINAKWFNYSEPGLEKEVETATIDAMIEHIAKSDPELAGAMRRELQSREASAN